MKLKTSEELLRNRVGRLEEMIRILMKYHPKAELDFKKLEKELDEGNGELVYNRAFEKEADDNS